MDTHYYTPRPTAHHYFKIAYPRDLNFGVEPPEESLMGLVGDW